MARTKKEEKSAEKKAQEEKTEETRHEIELLGCAMKLPSSVYIWGPPGVGKSHESRVALLEAGVDNEKVYQVTLAEDLTIQELIGHFVPNGDRFVWNDGPITRALKDGALIINEIQRASASVQDYLLGVLDSTSVRQIDLPNGGRVVGHENFRVIATSNTGPEDLDEALADRFDVFVEVKTPSPGVIKVLNDGQEGLGDFVANSYSDPARAISPRRALAYLNLKAVADEEQAARMAFNHRSEEFLMAMKGGNPAVEDFSKAQLILGDDGMVTLRT